ncbi:MAG: hypothetical protein E7Z74_03155 [Methanobrevibacter millerae]|uniref:PIN domain-containing protein n=1 Tax=Methanobrevibacter millerae TaxID=230361 RepID=A0A8T3VGB2_9EURY|nr:hypothetical protein [Methanobrevibacter millerae]
MFEINCHFLDTNVILSMILPNDNLHENTIQYFKKKYKRYLSDTVINESKRVIFKLKRIALKIISYVKLNILENSIDLLNVDTFLFRIKQNFIAQYPNSDFPEGIKMKKFISIVNQFFIEYNDDFQYSIISNDINNLEELYENIKNDYKIILKNLMKLFKKFICISFINKRKFTNALINIGIHRADAFILEEFFQLSESLHELIMFITFDKDILNLSNEINDIFPSSVLIGTLND